MRNDELYIKLLKMGYCDYNNPNYVWLPEMEFLTPEKMEYRKNVYNKLLYLDDLTIGGEDFFAWQNDDSVVFIELGTGNKKIFSMNLNDAIFRRIIEFASGEYVDMCTNADKADMDSENSEYYISEDEAKTLLKLYVDTFGDFFCEEQRNLIINLINSGFLDNNNAFISAGDLNNIVTRILKVNNNWSGNIVR